MPQTDPDRKGQWGAPLPGAPKPRKRASELHEARMARKGPPTLGAQGEAEVVPAEPLGSILRAWCVRWLQERPRDRQGEFVGPVNWLAEQTGIHIDRVEQICNGKIARVPLSQADKLLIAIDSNYMLGSVIRVKPNPNWSFEKWQEYMQGRGCF
jgi:hypothetical protein